MRRILLFSLLLFGAIWCLAHVEVEFAGSPAQTISSPWRRTRDGWERADRWLRSPPAGPFSFGSPSGAQSPWLHPLVLAWLETLAALSLLAAFAPEPPRRATG